jgi:hypothetical protein
MRRLKKIIHHFFVPSEHNNFRARGLHLDMLVFLLMIAITINTINDIWPGKILGYATDITIEKLIARTNQERTTRGLPPLRYNNQLSNAACNKAQDMFTYNYWAHYRPGDGTAPWYFIKQSGYSYEYAGENLAQGFLFSDAVVDGWMNSPTHRANIMRAEYDDVGFCVLNGVLQNEETTLVVQMFGKPSQPAKPAFVAEVQAAEKAPGDSEITPTPIVEKDLKKVLEQKPIVAEKEHPISLAAFSFNSSFTIIGLLLLILAIDLFFAIRLQIVRVSGRNLAHWLFLGSIAIALFIVKTGMIL